MTPQSTIADLRDSTHVPVEVRRLARHLHWARGGFSLAFVRWNHPREEGRILPAIRAAAPDVRIAEVRLDPDEVLNLIPALEAAAEADPPPDALFVYGLHAAFPDFIHVREDDQPPILTVLNLQRELFRRLPCAVVLWLPEHALGLIARGAADFWSWRSGVYDLELPVTARDERLGSIKGLINATIPVSRDGLEPRAGDLLAVWQDLELDGDIPRREWETAAEVAEQLCEIYSRTGSFVFAEEWRDRAISLRQRLQQDRETSPLQRANWSLREGNLWNDRPLGSAAANQQHAIRCYENALRVSTESEFPADWAMTQNNLGNAYQRLPTGDRAENLRQAIRCYENALRVSTESEFPADWAGTQNNLGNAYLRLSTGDRAENLRQAIRCYENALSVRTESEFPADWARTQNNLGNAYSELPTGDQAENLRQAIFCYENALRVWTESEFPADWAMTQNNLGTAYRRLSTGDRAENLRQAIRCYENALRVRTESEFPAEWAGTQNNLGNAYLRLSTGDRAENLRQAIRCYENALRVSTESEFPADWAMTHFNQGLALRELAAVTGNQQALRQARDCFLAAARGYAAAGMTQGAERAQAAGAELPAEPSGRSDSVIPNPAPTRAMADHPNKHIRAAIEYALGKGWTLRISRGHAWGVLRCPGDCPQFSVWSTPRNPENHARQIRRHVDTCPHSDENDE